MNSRAISTALRRGGAAAALMLTLVAGTGRPRTVRRYARGARLVGPRHISDRHPRHDAVSVYEGRRRHLQLLPGLRRGLAATDGAVRSGPASRPARAIGTTTRNDGGLQVTYNGMPLYYWAQDQQPGDTTGQNVGSVWFVVNPAPAPTINERASGDLGQILVDPRGMTLYLYTKDEPSVSNCYDQCAVAWPPLMTDAPPSSPDALAAGLGTTTRNDGGLQVTYNGMPLYYWQKDQKPGDTTGQNVGGVWFVVNP